MGKRKKQNEKGRGKESNKIKTNQVEVSWSLHSPNRCCNTMISCYHLNFNLQSCSKKPLLGLCSQHTNRTAPTSTEIHLCAWAVQAQESEGKGRRGTILCLSNWLLLPMARWVCNAAAFRRAALPADARWKHYKGRMQLRLGLSDSVGCNSEASPVQLTQSSQLRVKALHSTAPTGAGAARSPGKDIQLTKQPSRRHRRRNSSSDKGHTLIRQSKLMGLI